MTGGTAGLVVANRLSESGKFRVLVLEAGPDPNIVAAYKPLGGNQLLSGTAIDWRFETTPQQGLEDRILTYLREFPLTNDQRVSEPLQVVVVSAAAA